MGSARRDPAAPTHAAATSSPITIPTLSGNLSSSGNILTAVIPMSFAAGAMPDGSTVEVTVAAPVSPSKVPSLQGFSGTGWRYTSGPTKVGSANDYTFKFSVSGASPAQTLTVVIDMNGGGRGHMTESFSVAISMTPAGGTTTTQIITR